MNVNKNRKQKYIKSASQILIKEGREGISIRRIASEAGCTSAVLYKHFDNLDHLIMLASVQFLEPYMNQMSRESARKDISPVQLNLILWKEFLQEAFDKKDYYEMMFIGPDRDRLKACVKEYYDLFTEEFDEVDPVSANILFNNSVQQRELTRLKIAAEDGLITEDNANILSHLAEAVFAGKLSQYDGNCSPEEAAQECYDLIFNLYEKYVNPGTNLDI